MFYDGDGARVKSTVNGVTTSFIGSHYEVTNGVVTKYYFAGSQRIAMRTNGTLTYLLTDHLNSTSITTNSAGGLVSELRYKPWGETRYSSGTTSTKYQFNGQYSHASDFGLLFYNARYYDPTTGRFAQADSIVPGGVQGYDRYAYTFNNPVKYTDPTGHCPICLAAVIIAGAFLLTSDVQQPTPPPNPTTVAIEQVKSNSTSDADALITMFISDTISGSDPKSRLETVLAGTENGPYQHFAVAFGDEGFQGQYQDGGNQVGHFLSATDMAYNSDGPIADRLALTLITGHELHGDAGIPFIQHSAQFVTGLLNPSANDLFLAGQDSGYQTIIGMGWTQNPAYRTGNSVEDLRLSRAGWTFGKLTQNGYFSTRYDQADWLRNHIAQ